MKPMTKTEARVFRYSRTKPEHLRLAEEFARHYWHKKRVHGRYLRMAERHHGREGSLIAGGYYESWPESVKGKVRQVRDYSRESDLAYRHYHAAGKRIPFHLWLAKQDPREKRAAKKSRTRGSR